MNVRTLRSDLMLFITALIWGFAFVAQRIGMEDVGPFTFNGMRFALGALVLLPVVVYTGMRTPLPAQGSPAGTKSMLKVGLIAGCLLFAGASCQQVGLVYTTAGNAGFITGLYVVLVPFIGFFFSLKTSKGTWLGALLAATGLYLLSVTKTFEISYGDFLVFIGAFFWAAHVLVIGRYSPNMDSFRLAFFQYAACACLSLATAALSESITAASLRSAAWPIFYGGAISVGIAYTLQIIGQREAPSAHAAVLMSLESVFAALGGWMILSEHLSARQLTGCSLMMLGMLVSQLWRAGSSAEAPAGNGYAIVADNEQADIP